MVWVPGASGQWAAGSGQPSGSMNRQIRHSRWVGATWITCMQQLQRATVSRLYPTPEIGMERNIQSSDMDAASWIEPRASNVFAYAHTFTAASN